MRRSLAVPLVLVALGGCYWNYTTAITRFIGSRAKVGCIDVSVALTEDESAPSPIVAYQFGNSCAHQVVVDLQAVRVVALIGDTSSNQVPLRATDPRDEIHPMRLDAWSSGEELIAYDAKIAPTATTVCVDVGRIDPDAPPREVWKCLGATDGGPR